MRLSTGDIVEIEVCENPYNVRYILNGLKYETKTNLIKEFLFSNYLFTPDFDYWTGLEESVGIYKVNLINRLTCWIKPPLYCVDFDESLFTASSHHLLDYPKQLEILCEYLEALLSPRTKKQTCTIYS